MDKLTKFIPSLSSAIDETKKNTDNTIKTIFNRFSTFTNDIEQRFKKNELGLVDIIPLQPVTSPRSQVDIDDEILHDLNTRLKIVEKKSTMREEEARQTKDKLLTEITFLKSTISKLHDTEVENMQKYTEYILKISEKVEQEVGNFQKGYLEKIRVSEKKQNDEFKDYFFNMEGLTRQLFKSSEDRIEDIRLRFVKQKEEKDFKELQSKYTLNENELKLLKDHARRITEMEKNYVILSNNMSFHNLTKEIFKLSDNLTNETNLSDFAELKYMLNTQINLLKDTFSKVFSEKSVADEVDFIKRKVNTMSKEILELKKNSEAPVSFSRAQIDTSRFVEKKELEEMKKLLESAENNRQFELDNLRLDLEDKMEKMHESIEISLVVPLESDLIKREANRDEGLYNV